MVTEDDLINKIARALASGPSERHGAALRLGIGDDAAVIAEMPGQEWVLSCDAFLEDVHFRLGTNPPDSVGYKSLVRATSDLAAMGATPRFFLFTLAIPPRLTGEWLDNFLKGMRRASRLLKIQLAGGDTTSHPKISISLTVLGQIGKGKALRRSGARPGDLICVSGKLGSAGLGLALIQRGMERKKDFQELLHWHFYPRIRTELGAWLALSRTASAMMDISDGLSTDLSRLCASSRVGGRVRVNDIPLVRLSPRQVTQLQRFKFDLLELALHGGDDYELLFTVPRKLVKRLRDAPDSRHITIIGEIVPGKGLSLVDSDGRTRPLKPRGWDPFRKK